MYNSRSLNGGLMMIAGDRRLLLICGALLASVLGIQRLHGQAKSQQEKSQATQQQAQSQTQLPSETPAKLEPVTSSFDYTRREVMIPMRDGVKLFTVILVPKGAKNMPMLMTRTPYNAGARTSRPTSHLDMIVGTAFRGYIRVMQDVRGKYGSEGDYVMNRPLHGPQNPTPVDHSTDTYDTIDWLVKNIPESNGKVGIL